MADELKISRTYHEALRRLGIKNPGEVNVGVPVQLVAAVDSLAHLSPPVVVPVAGYGDPSGPHVGEMEIPVEYEARAGGLWCLYAETSSSSDVVLYCTAVTLITVGAAVVAVPGLQSPADGSNPLLSIIRHGRTAVGAPLGITLDVGQSFGTPFYVPPAHFVGLQCLTANQFVRASMMVQEVPLRAPGAE
jgi:hypothetical protein